jgi:Uma2 family endonuclease
MTTLLMPPPASGRIPVLPLQNGDNLTAVEFHRRYMAMPHVKKAELIRGVVYMSSPVSHEGHGSPHLDLVGWLAVYRAHTPGVTAGDNSTVMLDDYNTPQPDACLTLRHGQTKLVDGYLNGAPEFVAEVAASSVSYDLHQKKAVYAEFGVGEYLVWRVYDQAIDWFVLKEGTYEPLTPGADGVYRSVRFPGLWLDANALLNGDLPRVHATLAAGLADPAHREFVERNEKLGS